MIKDHSDSERGNPLPPHGLLFPISSNVSFIFELLVLVQVLGQSETLHTDKKQEI